MPQATYYNLLFSVCFLHISAYLSDSWSILSSDRPNVPKCVQIPENLTICHGIQKYYCENRISLRQELAEFFPGKLFGQYTEMRLPNLLEHETLREAILSSRDWENLLRLNCHPDTQLFLCSLYAPVCLDKEILPCKSLCEAVKSGCAPRMTVYGFPWPDMLSCDKYVDNDMCIQPFNSLKPTEATCPSCAQVSTYENLIDHFCRSQLVVKGKAVHISGSSIRIRNGRSLKKGDRRRSIGDTVVHFSKSKTECPCEVTKDERSRLLIMADRDSNGEYVANLIVPWQKDKNFKRVIHQFQRLNCHSLGREIRESASRRPHAYHMRTHNRHARRRL